MVEGAALGRALGEALAEIPSWTGHLQTPGNPRTLVLDGGPDVAPLIGVTSALMPVALVVIAPKAFVPADTLRAALKQAVVPVDSVQDLVLLDVLGDGQWRWPALLVDAIAIDDPQAAADIRASDCRPDFADTP